MALFDQFPWTNVHQLNLDWIIKICKEMKDKTDMVDEAVIEAQQAATLAVNAKDEIINLFVTPEMFDAVGDGVSDDTDAVREALKFAIDNGKTLYLPNTYYVTQSLLTASDYNTTVLINIEGTKPLENYAYAVDKYGGIKFADGLNLFDGLTLRGSIQKVTFAPVSRTQTGSIFHECNLSAFTFAYNTVSNILAFCHNSRLSSVSQIIHNRFLTVYYFAKCDSATPYNCTDSVIAFNYINGGMEMDDNKCFQWHYFNGSTVTGNFIDYYQAIYSPYNASGTFIFQSPLSTNNHYQVFRYFYEIPTNCTQFVFNSDSDAFNWTLESSLQKLDDYQKRTYTGHDSVTYDAPTYIGMASNAGIIRITNAYIQNNVGNLVFARSGLGSYAWAKFEFTASYVRYHMNFDNSVVVAEGGINTGGTYNYNEIRTPFIKDVVSLPDVSTAWLNDFVGELVRYDNRIYRFKVTYDQNASAWVKSWIDVTDTL